MVFGDFHWHDSKIKNISIDRTHPGRQDTIVIDLVFYDSGPALLIFEEVYCAKMNLNFAVVGDECIDMAYIATHDDPDLKNFYDIWKPHMNEVKLNCFVIKTSSTGSEIKIIVKQFNVTNKGS